MKKPARWRLSRRLLAGFVLLAVVPLLVVGLGIRQYTRTLLDESFAQRAHLTRQLIVGWRAQLQQRVSDAVRRAVVDPELNAELTAEHVNRERAIRRLERIAVESGVDGLDLFEVHGGGMLLIARSGHLTHFGFPVQVPPDIGLITVWEAPELGVNLYGTTAAFAELPRVRVAAYLRLDDPLLSELGTSESFLIGCRAFEGDPLVFGDVELTEWPSIPDGSDELVDIEVTGEPHAFGAVMPFYFGISLAERRGSLDRLDVFLMIAILLAVSVAIVAAWRVAVSAVRPVEELAETVGRWGRGGSREPLVTFAEGETATLVDAFEHLRSELAAAEKRLADTARAAGWQEMARKVAHEIKNPLTPIRVTMEDLSRRAADDPQMARQMIPEAARLVAEEVTALGRIVDAFSRYARLPEPQPVITDLSTVARDTVQLYKSAQGTGIQLSAPAGIISVMVDPQLLREALSNLVKNAVEASGTDGAVQVAVDVSSGQGVITITDTGSGFPERLLEEGPRPYFTTKPGGTGLGLVVSHRIVADMGGDLKLSNSDSGARAEVSFPLAG